jgi:hypothetical protein
MDIASVWRGCLPLPIVDEIRLVVETLEEEFLLESA